MSRWVAFILEGTLAHPSNDAHQIGKPDEELVARASALRAAGVDVRVVTEHAADPHYAQRVARWLAEAGLGGLPLEAAVNDNTATVFHRPNAYLLDQAEQPKRDAPLRIRRPAKPAPGTSRMVIMCPHCLGVATIRTSRQLSMLLREVYCQCTDVACSYSFRATVEVVEGISPSAKPNTHVAEQIDSRLKRAAPTP